MNKIVYCYQDTQFDTLDQALCAVMKDLKTATRSEIKLWAEAGHVPWLEPCDPNNMLYVKAMLLDGEAEVLDSRLLWRLDKSNIIYVRNENNLWGECEIFINDIYNHEEEVNDFYGFNEYLSCVADFEEGEIFCDYDDEGEEFNERPSYYINLDGDVYYCIGNELYDAMDHWEYQGLISTEQLREEFNEFDERLVESWEYVQEESKRIKEELEI